jgi:hypothetical protein
MEEGTEIQIKGIGKLFNEIISGKFSRLCNDLDTHVQESF